MKIAVLMPVALLLTTATVTTGYAEDNCIEDVTGRVVCGADADAVRVRLRFEERFRREGDVAPAAKTVTAPINASADHSALAGAVPVSDVDLQAQQQRPVLSAQAQPEDQSGAKTQPPAATNYPTRRAVSRGSVYSSYGQKVFVRGGYSFAGHGSNGVADTGPVLAVGYGRPINLFGDSISVEGEIVYVRDSETIDILGLPVETTVWGLTALASLRWQPTDGAIAPFASFGVGPAYYNAEAVGGGLSVSDGDFFLGYSGRVGAVARLGDQFSVEAAYRYLGAALNGTIGYHTAEVGVNYEF